MAESMNWSVAVERDDSIPYGGSRRLMRRVRQNILRYVLAALAAVVALALRRLLDPLLGSQNPYHTVWLAVVFCAWYCGIGPSVVAVMISVVGIWYWFLPPYHSFIGKNPSEIYGMLGFMAFSAVIVALGESTRRTMIKRRRAEEELRRVQESLEDQVRNRTAALEQKTAEAQKLSGRILTLQDEERRRMARGLHDSLGQYLAAVRMNLDRLAETYRDNAALASESSEIVAKCVTETRTISYLLHPPLLDEAGFGSAARWYVDGFAQRSGIKANLNLPPDLGRLDNELETALFRVVQEGLTNVHKHADSSMVDINLTLDETQVRLEIKDYGRGIPQERLERLLNDGAETGVGIAGLRERFRELGGSMELQSNKAGTRVIVTAPFAAKRSRLAS